MVPILQIGKGGIIETVVSQAVEALEARELIKCRVLQNNLEEPKAVAADLAEQTQAELVQVIGRNFLLFKQSKTKPLLELPN